MFKHSGVRGNRSVVPLASVEFNRIHVRRSEQENELKTYKLIKGMRRIELDQRCWAIGNIIQFGAALEEARILSARTLNKANFAR